MYKYIIFIWVSTLITSCGDTDLVIEETDYFSFERPAKSELDTIIYSEESSNVSDAQKAIGNSENFNSHIKGNFIIDGIGIYFALKNPRSNNIVPCYCSDYSEDYIKGNGEFFSQNSSEYRIVEGNNHTNKHWIELCIDMKHQFFVKEIEKEKFNMIKDLLKTIRIKL
ncbi:MAG: hypothetical protein MK066_14215 [Crocinitomicaceae bacterium]|nr:hypothetical protein [Crocinitomicaceae bacterium]